MRRRYSLRCEIRLRLCEGDSPESIDWRASLSMAPTKEELVAAFRVYDHGDSGTLSPDDIVRILTRPDGGQPFTEEEARRLVATTSDGKSDGKAVDYTELAGRCLSDELLFAASGVNSCDRSEASTRNAGMQS